MRPVRSRRLDAARALVKRMQSSHTQMAPVIDEYGGTDGLVSLEDLGGRSSSVRSRTNMTSREEPVVTSGRRRRLRRGCAHGTRAAAAVIGHPNFQVGERSDDIETIGGLVFAATGRIPPKGEGGGSGAGLRFRGASTPIRAASSGSRIRDRGKGRPRSGRKERWRASD